MAANQSKPASVDAYIAGFPAGVQAILKKVRTTIRKAAPDATETIKYGMPTFTLGGNLVFFSAWKKHIGVYGLSTASKTLKAKLKPYAGPKGSLMFPYDAPIPLDLIGDAVKARRMELLGTPAKKQVMRSARRKSAG